MSVKAKESVREHDGAGERQPERQPERAGRGVDPGGLADALLGDRRQRVVVELGDQQTQPAPAMISGIASVPAGGRPRDDRDQHADARRSAATKPSEDDVRWAGACPPSSRRAAPRANMLSESGAMRQAGLHRVVLEHHLQVDRQRDHHAAQRDLLEHLLGDARAEERLDSNKSRVDQRRLALRACAARSHQTSAASASAPDRP